MMEQGHLPTQRVNIHPENAGWYSFYLDSVRLGDGNRNSFYSFYSGVCPMAYQHLSAKQETGKAEYFFKRF
jgi:hypothetical protein